MTLYHFIMNRIIELFKIKYPIIQAGMIWCSGWELASAVSNAGGLGLIGSGSMTPDHLRDHIRKCKMATPKPFGANIPLLFPSSDEFIKIVIEEKVPIVFTSAGNPGKWTSHLKQNGIRVVHVIANVKFAKKCEEAGVDAIVAEGFEAGGHNGKEETTTMVLIPMVREVVSIPLIAAGGIGTGRGMLAAMALGAEGVQIGSRFVASAESSAHKNFKQKVIEAKDGDTQLTLKRIIPVRLIKNKFFSEVDKMETGGAAIEQLSELLGHGRARKGMFEGNLDEGELEIGQISGLIKDIKPAGKIVEEIMNEFFKSKEELLNFKI
jgi:enoyl-[acyl-carrier protein] reductase II